MTLSGAGSLTNNGVLVNAGDFVSAADIAGGKLVFTPAANANGAGYASFTFQVQDDGGTSNSGVDLDQSANTISIDVTAVNHAPAGTDNTLSTLEDTRLHLRCGRLRLQRPGRRCGQRAERGEDHDDARSGQLDQQRRAGDVRAVRESGRYRGGQLDVHARRQRQRGGLRELHLPGARRRRHGQRRRGPGSVRQYDEHRCYRGKRCAGGNRQHGDHAGRHRVYLCGSGLRLQRRRRQSGQCADGGEDHYAAGSRQPHQRRSRWSTLATSLPPPTSPAANWCLPRWPTPAGRDMRASPSKCRTMVVPRTVAWTWIRPPTP